MTRERFIKKWLGNNDFKYCEENKELMREDLDSVIEYAQQQVKKFDLVTEMKRIYTEFKNWIRIVDYVSIMIYDFPILLVRKYDWMDKKESTYLVCFLGFSKSFKG